MKTESTGKRGQYRSLGWGAGDILPSPDSFSPISPKGKIFDSGYPFMRIRGIRDEFEIEDAFPYRNVQLMRVNDTGEILAASLTSHAFSEQIIILCKEDSIQSRCAIQQRWILKFLTMIFLRG
jgi:hypothetical protein